MGNAHDEEAAPGCDRHRLRAVLGEQLVERRVAALAAAAGLAPFGDLGDRRRPVVDLAADAAFVDAVAQTHESHRVRKVPLILLGYKAAHRDEVGLGRTL